MTDPLINHVCRSVAQAYSNATKVSPEILSLEGMSGHKTRHLYNALCSLPGIRYLEVGTWKGSSLIAALYKNPRCRAYCVDNWSEFGGREDFLQNIQKYVPEHNLTVLDQDCWSLTPQDIPEPIDVFLYDGAHTYEDQKRAIAHFAPFLAQRSVIVVDDWMCDWVDVKRGTLDGLKEAPLKVMLSVEIPLVNTTAFHTGGDTFWNGCGVFVVERTDSDATS